MSSTFDPKEFKKVSSAKQKLYKQIGSKDIIAGMGITMLGEQYAIKVMFVNEEGEQAVLLPDSIDGFPVVTELIGEVSAQ